MPSGFMSALGGFAGQLNRNITAANTLNAARDEAWAIKTDAAAQNWNKQYSQDQQSADEYNFYKEQFKGDQYLADQAYRYHKMNPKLDVGQVVNSIKPNAGYSADPNYQSQIISGIQNRQRDVYGNLTNQMDRLPGNLRGRITQPLAPGGSNQSTDFSGGAGTTPTQPGTMPSASGPVNAPSDMGNFQTGYNPNIVASDDTTSSDGTNTPMQPLPQTAGNTSPGFSIAPQTKPNAALDPSNAAHWSRYADRDALRAALKAAGKDPNLANGAMTADEINKQKTDLEVGKKQNAADKERTKADYKEVDKYLHAPKDGLQTRMAQLTDIKALNYDLASMSDVLDRGFQASAVQPAYDELNRLTTAMLGIDLSKLGISNTVSDVQTLKKNVANAIIERLKTLHFGRITNYEAEIVKSGFLSNSNDPNTNRKIVLMMRALINQSQQAISEEYKIANNIDNNDSDSPQGIPSPKSVAHAKIQVANSIIPFTEDHTPWPKITGDTKGQEAYANLPSGTWFEYNGQMRQKP